MIDTSLNDEFVRALTAGNVAGAVLCVESLPPRELVRLAVEVRDGDRGSHETRDRVAWAMVRMAATLMGRGR